MSTPASARATQPPAERPLRASSPISEGLRVVGLSALLSGPILLLGGIQIHATWSARSRSVEARHESIRAALYAEGAHARLLDAPAGPMLPVDDLVHGRQVFASACASCHGAEARGVNGLGRDLTTSPFVAATADDDLIDFVVKGRPDAKPLPMPPKGGRDDLNDEDVRAVTLYLRGLQDARRMPELPVFVADTIPTQSQKDSALAAAGGDEELAEYIASGDRLFHSACIACHGKGGVGVTGNGKAMVNNTFIQGLDDDALLDFIKKGRTPTDPASTTGIQMPPKGGNPAISDDDILDIIAYLRTLQPASSASSAAK
ncbi:MAG: c-type cytochrome [Phycisphaeraceae bacterium]|nr:c-type cytochrome [Phycisphaeraceae bacterium]